MKQQQRDIRCLQAMAGDVPNKQELQVLHLHGSIAGRGAIEMLSCPVAKFCLLARPRLFMRRLPFGGKLPDLFPEQGLRAALRAAKDDAAAAADAARRELEQQAVQHEAALQSLQQELEQKMQVSVTLFLSVPFPDVTVASLSSCSTPVDC